MFVYFIFSLTSLLLFTHLFEQYWANPPLIPKYALGLWWNRERIYSFEDTKTLAKLFKRNGIPLSVLLLSEFWHIKDKNNYNLYRTGFSFNKELFPNPSEFINAMHNIGVRVGLNIDPVEGVRKEEDKYFLFSHLNHLISVLFYYILINFFEFLKVTIPPTPIKKPN